MANIIGFFLACVLIRRVFQALLLRLRLIWVTEYVSYKFLPDCRVAVGEEEDFFLRFRLLFRLLFIVLGMF